MMDEKQTQELIVSLKQHITFLEERLEHSDKMLIQAMEMCKNLVDKLKSTNAEK